MSDVVITTQLATRGSREFSLASENAFDAVYAKILVGDETALQDICDFALNLCKAESAGLSLLGFINDQHVFNWARTAGKVPKFKVYSPSNDCPCGTVLEMYSYQVFQHPENYYEWVKANKFVIPEMISMPIYRDDLTALGTFWVMHKEGNHFDWEDVRILTTLVSFVKTASRSDKFKKALTFS